MKMRWGYTVDRSEIISRAICRITGGVFSHSFAIFYDDPDHAGAPYYFESIGKRDATTGKTGVRGPIALGNVQQWAQERPRRLFALQPAEGFLPFTDEECRAAKAKLLAAVPRVSYAHSQILQNWLAQRTGVRVSFRFGSVDRWTCSETCVRVTPRRLDHFYGLPELSPDDIPPSGERLVSLWSGTQAMLRERV